VVDGRILAKCAQDFPRRDCGLLRRSQAVCAGNRASRNSPANHGASRIAPCRPRIKARPAARLRYRSDKIGDTLET